MLAKLKVAARWVAGLVLALPVIAVLWAALRRERGRRIAAEALAASHQRRARIDATRADAIEAALEVRDARLDELTERWALRSEALARLRVELLSSDPEEAWNAAFGREEEP